MLGLDVKRTFIKGEKVQARGHAFESAEVVEVLPNNKYKVKYSYYNENSRVKRTSGEKDFIWYELVKIDTDNNTEILNKRRENWKKGISFHNTRLMELVRRVLEGMVDLNPDYQRDFVWDEKDQELLITSIFEGIEIGKFAFVSLDFKEDSDLLYEILDGKQRATTLVRFITDQFKYKGKYFSELSREDRLYFMDYNITMGETRFELNEAEKREYFLRLNTRGREQTLDHINKVRNQLSELLRQEVNNE